MAQWLLPREAGRNSLSEAAARCETPVGIAVIDILEGRSETDRHASRQPGERVVECVRAGPAHLSEQRRQGRPAGRGLWEWRGAGPGPPSETARAAAAGGAPGGARTRHLRPVQRRDRDA